MPVHRILLVEDSDDDALLVQSELAKTGRRFAFRRVDNARDMQQALTEARWDVVISDHHMPGFDSIQAYHLVRRHSTDTPFIILSGAIAAEDRLNAFFRKSNDEYLALVEDLYVSDCLVFQGSKRRPDAATPAGNAAGRFG
jgi:CheY-like chemotaxis protein